MKHSILTKFRRPLAVVLLVLLILSLAGCRKKDDADSTGGKDPIPSESTAETTTAPIETTTEAPTVPTTEATTEAPTEAPTLPPVTEAPQEGDIGTVTANTLNIRKGPGSNYEKVGSYAKGDEVEILETQGDWGRTVKGWVTMTYVKMDKVTTNNTDNEKDNGKNDETISDEVVSDGKTTVLGYGVVNLGALNVRTGPGTNYEKVDTVGLGQRYAYYQRSGNWARIKSGWISVSYFYLEGKTGEADGAGTGTTTADLNIRSGPGTDYDRVGSVKKGETVKILTQINKWGYTSKGWVSMSYVQMEESESESSDATGTGTVTASTLNIRKSASKDSEKVGTYNKGDTVEILEVSGDWGRTDKGWVSMEYIDMGSTSSSGSSNTSTSETGTGTVTASSLYIRKKADKISETVGAYFKGDKVEILEVSGGWGRTDKGWIYLEYVKMDS